MNPYKKSYSSNLIICLLFLIAGCSSNSTGSEDDLKINGTWEGISESAADYLYIDMPNGENYDLDGECYNTNLFTLEHLSGDKYKTTNDEIGTTDTLTMRVENDKLFGEQNSQDFTFQRSEDDVTALNNCN